MTTIKDIAAKTGFSVTTVSLVLNNKKSRISENARQLIIKAARELKYIPNQTAVNLIKKTSKTLGLIITDISNPFYSALAKGVESESSNLGFDIILCDTEESYGKTLQYIRMLISKNVAGIIMVVPDVIENDKVTSLKEFMEGYETPVALIERTEQMAMSDCVVADQIKGGYTAAKYLLELGHRNIGCITGPSHLYASKERLRGAVKAFEEKNTAFRNELVVEGKYNYESGFEGTRRLLEIEPEITAVFAFNDMTAYGVYEYLNEAGMKIPERVSIIGFDDIFFSKMLSVPLTTMALPIEEMGRSAVSFLSSRILDPELPRRCKIVEPQLVIRKSTSKSFR